MEHWDKEMEAMNLKDIDVSRVLEGTNWIATPTEGRAVSVESEVQEAGTFEGKEVALFSSVMKMNDGSVHPALVVKDFSDGGIHIDTWLKTKLGWMSLYDEGLPRAVGHYHHDIFPFEVFIGTPWQGDQELAQEGAARIQDHIGTFLGHVAKMKESLSVES